MIKPTPGVAAAGPWDAGRSDRAPPALTPATRVRQAGGNLLRHPPAWVVRAVVATGVVAAASAILLALLSAGVGPDLGEPLVAAVLSAWMILAYVVGGAVAWARRPESRLGPLMVAAGLVMAISTLSWATAGVPFTLGQALDKVPQVLFLHVFLAFPSGRLSSRAERWTVAASYLVAVLFELARMVVGDYGPHNLLGVAPDPVVYALVRRVQLVLLAGLCLAGIVILLVQRRRAPPLRRWPALTVDAFIVALGLIVLFYVHAALGGLWAPGVRELRWAVSFTLGAAPVAFLAGVLQIRLARGSVADILVGLRAEGPAVELRERLARALDDSTVTLLFWLPKYGSWADENGREAALPGPKDGRATTVIDQDGAPVAALVHDAALLEEPELLEAVIAAAAMALENGRLHTELRARLQELAGSRLRVLEAGQRERKLLERDLHDGAQQRLVALSLELTSLLDRAGTDRQLRDRLQAVRTEIAASLEEIRDVARGLYPAVLAGHGLTVALESLAARSAVPLRLDTRLEQRLPEPIEVAVYYVVCEAMANIGKHAQATSASVLVDRDPDGTVIVEIADDGVGGAAADRGSGLRGLADRVEALGGTVQVRSPAGGGTCVTARFPPG
jgi:signal transduction histidine kinase